MKRSMSSEIPAPAPVSSPPKKFKNHADGNNNFDSIFEERLLRDKAIGLINVHMYMCGRAIFLCTEENGGFDGCIADFCTWVVHMMFEQTNLDAFRDAFCEQLKLKFKKNRKIDMNLMNTLVKVLGDLEKKIQNRPGKSENRFRNFLTPLTKLGRHFFGNKENSNYETEIHLAEIGKGKNWDNFNPDELEPLSKHVYTFRMNNIKKTCEDYIKGGEKEKRRREAEEEKEREQRSRKSEEKKREDERLRQEEERKKCKTEQVETEKEMGQNKICSIILETEKKLNEVSVFLF